MRLRTGILIATLAPLLSGCSLVRATLGGWDQDRDGLSRPQRELRAALVGGHFAKAAGWTEEDAMLRMLTAGATSYYASQYERSAGLLDTAALLADDRITSSVSRGALSLVTNDNARLYQPRRTERLFVPYYGMLAYSALRNQEDAAVEARRMASLLAQFAPDRDAGERALHATMHYLAGAVFERAGEGEAAAVSYRNAHALDARYPERPAAPAAGAGEVVVIVERGFVAHRVTESISIRLDRDDRDSLRGDDGSRRRVLDRIGARFASFSAAGGGPSSFQQRWDAPPGAAETSRRGSWDHDDGDDDDDELRRVRLAFPVLRRTPRPWASTPRLATDSGPAGADSLALRFSASVDDASAVDERRERAAIVTRELARATAKYAVAKAVRDKHGKVAGTIADIGAAMLSRADVRSWHVLPQEVTVLRVQLPAGRHQLRVQVGDGAGRREVSLGAVDVSAGAVSLLSARLWREAAPSRAEFCAFQILRCGY